MEDDKHNVYWHEEYAEHKVAVTAGIIDDDFYAAVAHVILPDGKLAVAHFRAAHYSPNDMLFRLVRKEAVEAARLWIDNQK